WWAPGATGLSANKFLFEIAGNANINSFGIFDPTNSANHLQLFSGPATAGWSTTLFVDLAGTTYSSVQFDGSANPQGPTTHATFGAANLFGYYLDTPNGFFYSVPGMNDASSAYPDGMPHMVAYQGGNGTYINGRQFLANEFLLAWEDQPFINSDLDYNDFVVMVESVHPVPEPAALGMFGLGALLIGAFVGMRRREQV
ncbi:MAG TPA: PEP-CTERM sorting domain-containing protein, partial [Rhodanobacter sp.]|nr:PEP-CTERM sorting domain-containing protein [Rhodanobacter sp.]